MGVVRDFTIEQLTQAVQGISTSGMSDTTGQAINNTLGTLMTNTTGQAINTTLQSLVEAISPSDSDVSSLVTISSGLTVVRKLAIKRNNIIMLDICIQGTLTDGATIATLDSAIRPSNTNIRVLGNVANNRTGHATSDGCPWFFASNGAFQYYGSTQTNAELVFSLMYII